MVLDDSRIELKGQLEFSDFLWANYWYIIRKFKFFIAIFFFVGFVYPVMYFAGFFGSNTTQTDQSNWGFLFIPGLVAFVIIGTYFEARRMYRSNRALDQPVGIVFSTTGIEVSGTLSSGRSSWETIRTAHETRRCFLLFVSIKQMQIIPKRYFDSDVQIGQFRKLLRDNLGKRAKIRAGASR